MRGIYSKNKRKKEKENGKRKGKLERGIYVSTSSKKKEKNKDRKGNINQDIKPVMRKKEEGKKKEITPSAPPIALSNPQINKKNFKCSDPNYLCSCIPHTSNRFCGIECSSAILTSPLSFPFPDDLMAVFVSTASNSTSCSRIGIS